MFDFQVIMLEKKIRAISLRIMYGQTFVKSAAENLTFLGENERFCETNT
jgi:hypothetical protein